MVSLSYSLSLKKLASSHAREQPTRLPRLTRRLKVSVPCRKEYGVNSWSLSRMIGRQEQQERGLFYPHSSLQCGNNEHSGPCRAEMPLRIQAHCSRFQVVWWQGRS